MKPEGLAYCSNQNCYFSTHAFSAIEGLSVCPACGSSIRINKPEDWMEELLTDQECWISDVDQWPSVLAYEYKQLKQFVQKKQPYGLMLCIKDNFETLLKLETLITYAWADLHTTEDFRKSTICLITLSNPSLGRWLELARLIIRNTKELDMAIPDEIPLEKLESVYRKRNLVNWRNEKIGHGALELDDDSEFRTSIRNMLILLKNTLEEISDNLSRQKLYAGSELLEGPDKARNLSCQEKIRCVLGDQEISLDPYVVIRKHQQRGNGIYFFDNQRTKTLTSFQAYAEGSWTKEANQYFAQLRKILEQKEIDSSATPDDPYLTEAENRELELVQMTHGFVKPMHLINWVQDCTRKHSKGVFHIEMERGMGKSVFTDKLNCLYANPLYIDDNLDVRTYHFSRSQTAGVEDVRSRVQWLWANQFGGGTWQRVPQMSDYEHNGLSFSSAFALFLEQARNYTERAREKSRIMMVLDGLDEITDEELWQMIPNPDQLSDGVYVLLASRNPDKEELTNDISIHLEDVKSTEKLVVDRENEDNKTFLLDYIEKTNNRSVISLSDEQKKQLLVLADYRVLQLCLLCKLLECGVSFDSLPNNEQILSVYLELLEQHYGEYESIRIREILAVLCTLGSIEPICLNEIGALTSENRITIKLIGMLRDLSPLLKVIRSDEGNRYTIVNPSMSKELMNQLPEIDDTIRNIVDLVFNQFSHGWPLECPETTAAATNVISLSLLRKESVFDLLPDEYGNYFTIFLKGANYSQLDAKGRKLYLKYIEQVMLVSLNNTKKESSEKNTYNNLEMLGLMYITDGQYRKALQIYQKVLDYRLQHPEDNSDLEVLKTRGNIANICKILSLYDECEKENEIILGKYEELYGKDSVETIDPRLRKIQCRMHKESNADLLNEAQSMLELCRSVFPPGHDTTLFAMSILSHLLADNHRYDESIALMKEELGYGEKKRGITDRSLLPQKKELAGFLTSAKRYEEAYDIYQQIIPVAEKTLGESHPAFLDILNSYAILLSAVGRNREARDVQRRLVKENETLFGAHTEDTFIAKGNLAATLSRLGEFKEAFDIYYSIMPDMRRMYGSDSKRFLETQKYFARVVIGLKKYKVAIGILDQFIAAERRIGGDEYEILAAELEMAFCRSHLGDPNQDLRLMMDCASRISELCGADSIVALEAWERVVDLLDELHGYAEIIRIEQDMIKHVEARYGTDHPLEIKYKKKLKKAYEKTGELEKAIQLQSEISEKEALIGYANTESKIKAMNSQISMLLKSNRIDEALVLSRETYELAKSYYRNDPEEVLYYGKLLADLLKSVMRRDEATKIDEELLATSEKCYGVDSDEALKALYKVAKDYVELHKDKEALELVEKILIKCINKNEGGSKLYYAALSEKASIYKNQGRINDSIQINKELAEIYAKNEGDNSTNRIVVLNNLGNALYDLGRFDEALKIRLEIQKLVLSKHNIKSDYLVMVYYNLGNSFYSLGRYQEALENQKKAMEYCVGDKRKGVEPILVKLKMDLARTYEALGMHDEAEKVLL